MFNPSLKHLEQQRLTEILNEEINDILLRQWKPNLSEKEYNRLDKEYNQRLELLRKINPYFYSEPPEPFNKECERNRRINKIAVHSGGK